MSEDVAPGDASTIGAFGRQVALVALGVVASPFIAWLAILASTSVTIGAVAVLLAAAAVYRSRLPRAAAVGMLAGGGVTVVFFTWLFYFTHEGLSAM